MPRSRPERLEAVSEDDYLFHVPTGEVVRIVDIDSEFQKDDARHDGTVTMTVADGGDETFMEDADAVDNELHHGDLQPVSDELLRDPDRVLLEFARQEIGNYVSRLGNEHDFNGIDGVRIVADLRAAEFLSAHSGSRPRLEDDEYVTFLDWLMVSDQWPLGESERAIVKHVLNREAEARGYADWLDAYHEMTEVSNDA